MLLNLDGTEDLTCVQLLPNRVRWAALFAVNLFVFMGNMYASGLATGFGSLAEYFHIGDSMLSGLVTYSVLAMGLSNLFWMPLALCFGKRPIVLIAMAMFLCGCIWSAVAKDYNSLLGSRVFASFGKSPLISETRLGANEYYRLWCN